MCFWRYISFNFFFSLEIQERFHQTAEEVSRLKKERKKLMDVGNELRGQLRKVRQVKYFCTPMQATDQCYFYSVIIDSY